MTTINIFLNSNNKTGVKTVTCNSKNFSITFSPKAYITEFFALAPKTYSYSVFIPETGKTEYKTVCKGFTLGREQGKEINFHSMKKLLFGEIEKNYLPVVYKDKIKRLKTFEIVSETQLKKLQSSFLKRVVTSNLDTLPLGFVKEKKNTEEGGKVKLIIKE